MHLKEIAAYLRRFFSVFDREQNELSDHWREHANQRTVVVIIVGGAIAIFSYLYFIRPPDAFPLNQLVTIPPKSSLSQTATVLKEQHVIRSALFFEIYAILTGRARHLHAGDYIFKQPLHVFGAVRVVGIGAYGLEPIHFRIREGSTVADMAKYFGDQLQRFNTATFLSKAQPLEGYLFPDTYYFLPNATESTIIQAMRQNFDEHMAPLQDELKSSGRSLADIVTMASILEREAPPGDDRKMIAGVLWKRIKIGMPLQVDVTFLYINGKGTFQITKDDLANDSPYNTYRHKGLPPGPIGSPSLNSLKAALEPAKNDYLYFLADSNGVTHYSKTFEEQVKNKNRYF